MKKKKLVLHNLIFKEGKSYTAICLELNVASQGKTVKQASANLQEAVELFLDTVLEDGEEDKFIPRPAAAEFWRKYSLLEVSDLRKDLKKAMAGTPEYRVRVA
jgi:predicted RNase H-like HicB family nuclease